MRTFSISSSLIAVALLAHAASANSLIYQLPEDGAWAVFKGSFTNAAGGQKLGGETTVWLGSVGRATVNGKKCRWIEARFDVPRGAQARDKMILKALVPEEQLAERRKPLDHVVRAWVKHEAGEAKKIKNVKAFGESPLALILAGPLTHMKRLPPEPVDSKLGELPCEGVTGTCDLVDEADEQQLQVEIVVENRLNETAPFGVVTVRWEMRVSVGDQPDIAVATFDLTLADFGTGAKSELPKNE